jgi:hypothetical protein
VSLKFYLSVTNQKVKTLRYWAAPAVYQN